MDNPVQRHPVDDSSNIIVSFESVQSFGTIRGNRSVPWLVWFWVLSVSVTWAVVEYSFYAEYGEFSLAQAVIRLLCSFAATAVIALLSISHDYHVCSKCGGQKARWSALCDKCWGDYELEKVREIADLAKSQFCVLKASGGLDAINERYKKAIDALRGRSPTSSN